MFGIQDFYPYLSKFPMKIKPSSNTQENLSYSINNKPGKKRKPII